jgi:hypothetical protein
VWQRLQFLVVQQAEQRAQQRRHHQHQQQEVAEARVEIGPDALRQQPRKAPDHCAARLACGLHRSPQRASSVQHSEQIGPW